MNAQSRKVRTILRLDARALKLDARCEAALARAATARLQATDLRRRAQALELQLTGSQTGELRRARAERR